MALHPDDPDVFVIAVSDGRPLGPAGEDGAPDATPRGLATYATTDGGATFVRHRFPLETVGSLPVNAAPMGADPAVAFDADGTLHFTGIILSRTGAVTTGAYDAVVFYAKSVDLGASWSTPVVLDNAGMNDREWLTVAPDGTLFVTWRDINAPGSKVAWSTDAGDSWNRDPEALVIEGCVQISPTATLPTGEHVVACRTGPGDLTAYQLDLATSESTALGTAVGGCRTNSARLTTTPNGTLIAACYYGMMTASHDGGRTWLPAVDVFELTQVDDDWSDGIGPNIFALAADPWGAVHLLLTNFPAGDDQLPGDRGDRPVAHVVLDPLDLSVLHEVEVKSRQPRGEAPTEKAFYGYADDYYEIEFSNDRGLMVWTSDDWTTEYAWVQRDPGPGEAGQGTAVAASNPQDAAEE